MFWDSKWPNKRTNLDIAAGVSANPSSPHAEGMRAKDALEKARTAIARLVEVQSDDVIFTSGATEANALAILGHVRALRKLAGRDTPGRNNMHVLYLPSAHASIVENIKILAEEGIDVEALPIRNARVDTDALATMIRNETVLISMEAVCGETGVIWNTREVSQLLQQHGCGNTFLAPSGLIGMSQPVASKSITESVLRADESQSVASKNISSAGNKIMFHVDASQAPWTEKITRAHFGADMLTFDGAKVGAMHGIGALIAHRTIPLMPLYGGGGQERGLRSGTVPYELAEKFAAALGAAAHGREKFSVTAKFCRDALAKEIIRTISDVHINEGAKQVPNILNLSLIGRDTDYLVALLDEAGFAVSTRSACETDSESGSRAVFALTGDSDRARSTLRISWGPDVSVRQLLRFCKPLAREVEFIDKGGHG